MAPYVRLLSWLVVACVPAIAAPQCQSVHPSAATDPVYAGQQSVEPKLVEANADSVLVLGISNWNEIEPCNTCSNPNCTGTSYPSGSSCPLTGSCATLSSTAGQHIVTVGSNAYKCNYRFQTVDDFLKVHVDPNGTRTVRRHFMIQMAPIFHNALTVPPYAQGTFFDPATATGTSSADTYLWNFKKLWDKMRPLLMKHVNTTLDPAILIGLGNEVNYYINNLGAWSDGWDRYQNFVTRVVTHINSTTTTTSETFSTQWYGGCGLGDWIQSVSGCSAKAQKSLDVMRLTDQLTITYYPIFAVPAPSNMLTRIQTDFNWLTLWANQYSRPGIVQEVGHPTGQSPTQKAFIDQVFAEYAAHYDHIKAVNYFRVHDVAGFSPTGFFNANGTAKAGADWTNFKNKMAAVPP
jgi:hypothetical protein